MGRFHRFLPHGDGDPSMTIAVVGYGCAFPDSRNPKEYFRLLRRGDNAIRPVPQWHWNPDDYSQEVTAGYGCEADSLPITVGGFVPPLTLDIAQLGMPEHVLPYLDSAQLLTLYSAQNALRHAGLDTPGAFDPHRAIVAIGAVGVTDMTVITGMRMAAPIWRKTLLKRGLPKEEVDSIITEFLSEMPRWKKHLFSGLLPNIIAGRVANCLNIKGANILLDGACASSFASLYFSMNELEARRTDLALAGGVDALNHAFMFMCFTKTGMVSPTGELRAFDANADGTLLGEGSGVLVLKRLDDALRDGNTIHALVRTASISSDGRGKSIYAPDTSGQQRAMTGALHRDQILPQTITMIEGHGTGTSLGDRTEIESIVQTYEQPAETSWPPCAVGSVKSQIGHTKAASGMAGLIKAIHALKSKILLPTARIRTPHPAFPQAKTRLFLPTRPRPWFSPNPYPRRAAVSSFGFGGCNGHAVLEEFQPAKSDPSWDGSVEILTFSAEDFSSLQNQIQQFLTLPKIDSWSPEFHKAAAMTRLNFTHHHPFRAAAVLSHPKPSSEALQHLLQGSCRISDSLFFSQSAPASTAPTFSIHSPSSTDLLEQEPLLDLVCLFPEYLQAFDEATAALGENPGLWLYPPLIPDFQLQAKAQLQLPRNRMAAWIPLVRATFQLLLHRFGLNPASILFPGFNQSPTDQLTAPQFDWNHLDSLHQQLTDSSSTPSHNPPSPTITLIDRLAPYTSEVPTRNQQCGIKSLARLLAYLAVEGHFIRLDQWEQPANLEPVTITKPYEFTGANRIDAMRRSSSGD
jgi:acyl transferase domain-containing protein